MSIANDMPDTAYIKMASAILSLFHFDASYSVSLFQTVKNVKRIHCEALHLISPAEINLPDVRKQCTLSE
ncbi:MAG: hypothetical protein ACE5HS_06040 [bacterium]